MKRRKRKKKTLSLAQLNAKVNKAGKLITRVLKNHENAIERTRLRVRWLEKKS